MVKEVYPLLIGIIILSVFYYLYPSYAALPPQGNITTEPITPVYIEICGVNFTAPFFNISKSGGLLLLMDSNGNLYINSSNVLENTDPSDDLSSYTNYFIIRYFSDIQFVVPSNYHDSAKIKGVIKENQSSLPTVSDYDIVFRARNTPVGIFKVNEGSLYIKGMAVLNGRQAGCIDGYYCNGDILENRDYYCNAYSGQCEYSLISSEDCSQKPSTDTDGGDNPFVKGTVKDYTTCSGTPPNAYCSYNTYTDFCTISSLRLCCTPNCDNPEECYLQAGGACEYGYVSCEVPSGVLTEYYPDGTSYGVKTYNCDDFDGYYCADSVTKEYRDYSCSDGRCSYTVVNSTDCNEYCTDLGFPYGYCSNGECICRTEGGGSPLLVKIS